MSKTTVRSIRITQEAWEGAKERARADGTTITAATADLLEGYARGVYQLPTVSVVKSYPGGREDEDG